jgi:alanyl-tRNA synthetase
MKYGEDKKVDIAMRVIADHIRTIAFSIADSQLPSNAKAGYVIRRILRRAVRYAYTFLGQKSAFIYRLVDTLIDSMGEAYPELSAQRELIMKVIKEEEEAFLRTLDKGIVMLDQAIAKARKNGKKEISGEEAFTLYDTYGFPLDLTELILKENEMTLDQEGFDKEMLAQKTRARNAASVEATDWQIVNDGEQEFVGYDETTVSAKILRYRHVKQKNRQFYQIIFDRTPFYAEMGGQVGDRGTMVGSDEKAIEIFDTKRENGVGVHMTAEMPANVNDTFTIAIDVKTRQATAANHTATHLLHQALREVLGTHVEQKGSFVSPEVLRFDFSHFQKLTPEEISKVEKIANERVRQAIALDERRNMPIAKAKELGAMALFGEKYGDEVRVIKYGDSVELCGGTHVANTGNIGMIKIISESSIAAGIRRIEAITALQTEKYVDHMNETLRTIASMFNNAPDLVQALRRSIEENADLKKQAQEALVERANNLTKEVLAEAVVKNGIKLVKLGGVRLPEVVKNVAFNIKRDSAEMTAFIAGTVDATGKPMLTVSLTDDLVKKGFNAGTIVRQAAKHIKGGGGGQPGFAQAGGKDANGLSAAYDDIIANF